MRSGHLMVRGLPNWQTKTNRITPSICACVGDRKLIELFLLVFLVTGSREKQNDEQENGSRVGDNRRCPDGKHWSDRRGELQAEDQSRIHHENA